MGGQAAGKGAGEAPWEGSAWGEKESINPNRNWDPVDTRCP